MRFFEKVKDGGANSPVDAYVLIEIKSLFSIMVLHFNPGYREALHSHAFNAFTIWLWGEAFEVFDTWGKSDRVWWPGFMKFTPRSLFHRYVSFRGAWALTFRGPWHDTWEERCSDGRTVTLTHGRKAIAVRFAPTEEEA